MFGRRDIERLAEIVLKYPGMLVLSDEIYDRIVFEGDICSIASVPGMKDRTIILDGFSKTYSMTGWRIGYGIMEKSLAENVGTLMVNSNSCTASFTQIAAKEAILGPQDKVEEMRLAFLERRNYIVEALNRIGGIECNMPMGAFYVFPDISSYGIPCEEFCRRLMHEGGVAASAGTGFGSYGEGCMRLSYATSMENIREAVKRIASFTAKL